MFAYENEKEIEGEEWGAELIESKQQHEEH